MKWFTLAGRATRSQWWGVNVVGFVAALFVAIGIGINVTQNNSSGVGVASGARFCSQCGSAIDSSSQFCAHCGKAIK